MALVWIELTQHSVN